MSTTAAPTARTPRPARTPRAGVPASDGASNGAAEVAPAGAVTANAATPGASAELEDLRRTNEALEQASFERERLIATYAAQVAALRDALARTEADAAGLRVELARSVEFGVGLNARLEALLGSTSWKASLPLRVVRRPGPYLRKLRRR